MPIRVSQQDELEEGEGRTIKRATECVMPLRWVCFWMVIIFALAYTAPIVLICTDPCGITRTLAYEPSAIPPTLL